ncbi:hypothetical protein [Oceanospirillum beijerinckii]|uniref:hypothetical protein n=1 Tax=Oceanospirillum beijerinckii TaxID=64976 RepID=UPI0012FF5155|nr:hypothetical protein [Oceanospirillum beijerinckii]
MSLIDWCIDKISGHGKVESISKIDSTTLELTHQNTNTYAVSVFSCERMNLKSISDIDIQKVDFILNIKKDAYISGKLMQLMESADFSIGGLGDLYSALGSGNLSNYISKEMQFVIRGLSQHNKVKRIYRLDNRRFEIERKLLPDVTILVLNDYDLTAESVRSGIDKYGDFDSILTSNPNCRRSSNAEKAAENSGRKIMSWGELMGNLNKKWN